MTPEAYVRKIQAAREFAVALDDKRRLIVRRPAETQILELFKPAEGGGQKMVVGVEQVKSCVVGWEGFVESDLFPAGGSDPVEFHPLVFAAWVEDNRDVVGKVAQEILDRVLEHEKQQEAAEKN